MFNIPLNTFELALFGKLCAVAQGSPMILSFLGHGLSCVKHFVPRAAYLENEDTKALFEILMLLDRLCIDEKIVEPRGGQLPDAPETS
jgi:hypothetical protein